MELGIIDGVKAYLNSWLCDEIITCGNDWTKIHNKKERLLSQTKSCLVTHVNEKEDHLLKAINNPNAVNPTYTTDEVKAINEFFKQHNIDPTSFDIVKDKGTSYLLKLKAPSYCPLCGRTHDNQNASVYTSNCIVYYRFFQNPTPRKIGETDRVPEGNVDFDVNDNYYFNYFVKQYDLFTIDTEQAEKLEK